jgi:toxin FitB
VIVVDTNVLSELVRLSPNQRVLDWLRSQVLAALFTTTITEGELLYGLALLPPGRRHAALADQIDRILMVYFGARVLPFDSAAAGAYADIAASRRQAGRPISEPDARIAAIARSREAAVATRNTSDFAGCGVTIIDPWR